MVGSNTAMSTDITDDGLKKKKKDFRLAPERADDELAHVYKGRGTDNNSRA